MDANSSHERVNLVKKLLKTDKYISENVMGVNFWILMLALAVLGWNVYTIIEVGIANATTLQWVYVGVMVFIVVRRGLVMYLDKKRAGS